MSSSDSSVLHGDIFGGVTAAVIALPLALAFGVAAFAPLGPEYASTGALVGLLGAIFTGFFAAWFGGTPVQVTGPTGPMTVVAVAFIAQVVTEHGANLQILAILLALAIVVGGVFQIIIGLAGGGRVVKFMPYPVVAGFMNGIAIIIFLGQIKPFLGITGDWVSFDLASGAVPIAVGTITVGAMVASQFVSKKIPAALVALVAGIVSYLVLASAGYAPMSTVNNTMVIGVVPNPFASWEQMQKLMPVFQVGALQNLGLDDLRKAGVAGLALGVLGSIDSLLTSLVADSMTHSRHDSRKELVGQGIGNIVSGLGGGLAGAGATVRTLVNINAGGRTRRSGMIHSAVIFLVVVALGAPAGWIPLAALAGILFVTAVSMIDTNSLQLVKRRKVRHEFAIMVVVASITVLVDLMVAVGIGVAIAALLFISQQIRQPVLHRRLRGNVIYSRRVRTEEEVNILREQGQRIMIYELKGSLFFGTADALAAELESSLGDAEYFIIDLSRVDDVDLSGIQILLTMVDRFHDAGMTVFFSGLTELEIATPFSVRDMLIDLGGYEKIGEENIFTTLDYALETAENHVLEEHGAHLTDDQAPLTIDDVDLFAHLPDDDKQELLSNLETVDIKEGDYLFNSGDPIDSLVLVRSGRFSILKRTGDKITRLATMGPGSVLGLRALLEESERVSSGVRAESDASVYFISCLAITHIAERHPESLLHLQQKILANAMNRLDLVTTELILLEEG